MLSVYKTSRLNVVEVVNADVNVEILSATVKLLTENVVENLPPNFHGVSTLTDAQHWFEKMVSDSRLFMVKHLEDNTIIGFVFLSTQDKADAHIGYLLGQCYWGKGFATEILYGLINFLKQGTELKQLIAGVAASNLVSSNLLIKVGFEKSSKDGEETTFYKYLF